MATFATIYDDQGTAYRVTIGFDTADNPTLCIVESPTPGPVTGCCQWIPRPCWIECGLLGLVSKWAPCIVDLKRDMILAGYDYLWKQLIKTLNMVGYSSEGTTGYTVTMTSKPVAEVLKQFQYAAGDPEDSVQIGNHRARGCNNHGDLDPNNPCCHQVTEPEDKPCPCDNTPVERP